MESPIIMIIWSRIKHGDPQFVLSFAAQKVSELSGNSYSPALVESMLKYFDELKDRTEAEYQKVTSVMQLAPNMVLARSIYSMSGKLLLAKGAVLTTQSINRIRSIARLDPIVSNIYTVREDRFTKEAIV